MQAAARGLVACQQHDATRRLRIARPVLPRITARTYATYVRTYVRSLFVLSLSPPFPRSVPPRIHRRVEGARVRACVFLRGGILLQSFSPFTQCANIINGKVCIPVIGKREDRVVHRGCTISLGYSAVTVATRKVIP